MKCYKCGSQMEQSVELIIHNGKTIPQSINECKKCGEAIVSIDEYERVRKELHPSIFGKIKGLFKFDTKFVEVSKGKLL